MSVSYTYFLNSKAEKSLMFGPGLLRENAIKTETMFYIQARNVNNQNRESGADDFIISITRPDMVERLEKERERIKNEEAKMEEENAKNAAERKK